MNTSYTYIIYICTYQFIINEFKILLVVITTMSISAVEVSMTTDNPTGVVDFIDQLLMIPVL